MTSHLPTAPKESSLALDNRISSIQILFRHDERLCHFLFHHQELRLRATAAEILEEARLLAREERILVQLGLDFWSGSGAARLAAVVEHLDDERMMAFLRAVLRLREMDLYVTLTEEAPYCD
jgi:hypothetical protein